MNTSTIPPMGLGTFPLEGDAARQEVRTGLELGYRLVDTAPAYGNEAEVGQAAAESGLPRGEVFLTPRDLLREAIALLGPGAFATNQMELHPYLQNRKLAAFCHEQGIVVTPYMALARGQACRTR